VRAIREAKVIERLGVQRLSAASLLPEAGVASLSVLQAGTCARGPIQQAGDAPADSARMQTLELASIIVMQSFWFGCIHMCAKFLMYASARFF